tara:strand:+ start:50 stop:2203 length:2154 start_codon:yes stop_codon:yes gene_type:complete
MNTWDKILKDFSHKCKGGAPNLKNPTHLQFLRESLIKFGWTENATNEFIGNLREGKFQALSKKGNVSTFDSAENRDTAIEKGTHTPIDDKGDESDEQTTTTTAEQDLDSLTDQRDKIFTGETTPPGTGGSAVMETIGGEYSEDIASGQFENETEEDFVKRQLEEKGDKPPLDGLSDKDKQKWLKIAYKKGKNDIDSLKGNPEHDYGKQPKGYPKAASGDADTAKPILDALEKKKAEAKTPEDKAHYDYQIKKLKERVRQPGERASGEKDSDSLLIYHDSKGRLRIHHISDKSSLNDTFMNKTIETKRVSHEKASESVGRDMNLSKEETEAISSSINQKEAEVGEDVKNTGGLPHKTLKDKSDEEINEGVNNGLGGIMGNLGSGQRGRRDYSDKINGEIKNAKTTRSSGYALKQQLDRMGVEPDENGNYSQQDIAMAILKEVRDNPKSPWRKYVDKMGTAIGETRSVAGIVERGVRKKAEKEDPKPSEKEIQNRINQQTAERMNGEGKDGRKQDSSEPAKPITAEDVANIRKEGGIMDELNDMSRTMKDSMGAAHRKIKQHILDEDKKLGFPDEDGKNGPHTQTYIESWMNDMHFYRHFDGPPWEEDGDDNGDEDGSINVGGKNLKSKAIVDCFKEQTGYPDKVETKEDKKKFWKWMRENMRINSEDDSVTIDTQDGNKQVGRQNYRSAGSGVQKVTGNFGKDIQACAKKKLAESGQV